MIYVFYVITGIYAILCVLAPATQTKKWKTQPSLVSMLTGGVALGTSLVLKSSAFRNAWILAAVALVCICISAWRNGGMQEKRNLFHHIMRGVISILILIGFILL